MAEPINQITTMRLPDGSEVAFVDWSDTPLWSSADLLAGFTDTEIDLFQYVSGEPVPKTTNLTVARTSSDNDTNIASPGIMASTEEMLVYAIKPEIIEQTLSAQAPTDPNSASPTAPNMPQPTGKRLSILQQRLLLTLEVSQKFTHRAPLTYYNSGFGAFAPSIFGVPVAGVASAATPGLPSQDAVRALVIPVHIGGQETYRVRLENVTGSAVPSGLNQNNPAANEPLVMHTVRILLDGLYKRPVA
jgi:hypothetical protein